jgi:hypothetical protein
MAPEVKAFRFSELEMKAAGDAGTIKGHDLTLGGDPDAYGDIIVKGAFANSIAKKCQGTVQRAGRLLRL